MRTTQIFLTTCLLALAALAGVARAEGPQTPPPPPPNGGTGQTGQQGYYEQQQQNQQGYGQQQNGQQQPDGQVMGQPGGNGQPVMGQPQTQTANQQAQRGRGIEYGAYLYVPIFLASNVPPLGAGIGIQGRIGWEFGSGFTAELQGGVSWNSFDAGTIHGLTDFWVGGGIRYAFLNPSPFVPFLGAGLNVNFWGYANGGTNDYLSLGFNALAGAAYEVSADVAIEAGLQFFGTTDTTGHGTGVGLFNNGPAFGLAPFAGLTLYY